MKKPDENATLSFRLQGLLLEELIRRAKQNGQSKSKYARILLAKAILDQKPPVYETTEEVEIERPYALKLLLKASENAGLQRIADLQGVKRQDFVIGLIRSALAAEPQFTKTETQTLFDATWELRRIGMNINQIARRLNEEAKLGKLRGTEAEQFLKFSSVLQKRIDNVANEVGKIIQAGKARCKLVEVARENQS